MTTTATSESAAIRRLFDRFGFGPTAVELDTAIRAGYDATLERLLGDAAFGADGGAAATPAPNLPLIGRPGKQADPAAKKASRQQRRAQVLVATAWWLDRMVAVEHPVVERLTWFWHGHFATSAQKVRAASLMLEQNATLRRLGTRSADGLARAMLRDPAMLIWLDGAKNTVGSANENLSREFMELFVLGHGAYAEVDVRETARALTGWTLNRKNGTASYRDRRHDDGDKTIFGSTARFDTDSFADLVLARPQVAPFVTGRLWFRLVSAGPPSADVSHRLVAAYGKDGDVRAVLRAIAAEPAFRADGLGLVKQPVEWAVGLMRAVGVRPSRLDTAARRQLGMCLRGMGQVPFLPPSVGGWPSAGAWLTTAAATARVRAARIIAGAADLSELGRTSRAQRVEATRRLLGVSAFSTRTTDALAGSADDPVDLVTAAAVAPEVVVSG